MPDDRYTEHPALRPTILANAMKPMLRQPQPSPDSNAGEDHGWQSPSTGVGSRGTPRAA